jgi:flagellar protein FlgJ
MSSILGAVPGVLTGEWQREAAENRRGEDPARLREVAAQFEGLLLAQMLKSLREAGDGGWLGGGDDQAGVSMVEMAEQQFAQLLASQGGLGLANLIVEGLSRQTDGSGR